MKQRFITTLLALMVAVTAFAQDGSIPWRGLPKAYLSVDSASFESIDGVTKRRSHVTFVNNDGWYGDTFYPEAVSNFTSAQLGTFGTELRVRGNTTSTFDKKPHNWELFSTTFTKLTPAPTPFGLPAHAKYSVLAAWQDSTKLRAALGDAIAYAAGQEWASRGQLMELHVSDNTQDSTYWGLYWFKEKVEAAVTRINITEAKNADTTFPNITGGYVYEKVRVDQMDAGEIGITDMRGENWSCKIPGADKWNLKQREYSKSIIDSFFTSLTAFPLSDTVNGYRSRIHDTSFATFMIAKDLLKDPDTYVGSWYVTKPRNGKLRGGSVWDHDGAMPYGITTLSYTGSTVNYSKAEDTYVPGRVFYYDSMMRDPHFANLVAHQFNKQYYALNMAIDDFEEFAKKLYATGAIQREGIRWPTSAVPADYLGAVRNTADYAKRRIYYHKRGIYDKPTPKPAN